MPGCKKNQRERYRERMVEIHKKLVEKIEKKGKGKEVQGTCYSY